ncbi:MAG: hypothetical protein ABSA76_11545 [Bacteroidales bacterium]
MRTIEDLNNVNQQRWLEFIKDGDLSEFEEEVYRMFFMKDNIDIGAFQDNIMAYEISKSYGGLNIWEFANSLSDDPKIRNQKICCSPTFRADFANNEVVPPGFPEWLYLGYPDVVVWMENNSELIDKEYADREEEISTDNGFFSFDFYRIMIDRYKHQVGKLECSILTIESK